MNRKLFLLIILLIFSVNLQRGFADIFYTPTQYNKIYNEKVAAELQLKALKRQFSNEKGNLESKNKDYEGKIDSLNNEIDILKKQMGEYKISADKRIAELEKRTDILQKKGSDRENELIEENRKLQKRFEAEIDELKNKLNSEREENDIAMKALREKYQSKISDLEKTITNLTNELSDLKDMNKKQRDELEKMESQAQDLEKQLEKEIKNGDIRLKRYHNKLIINLDDKICFDSGSSELKKGVLPALNKIVSILNKYPENRIIIEGHTDNVPIKSKKFRDNWQLSTERALSVLAFLLKNKELNPLRFSAAGYGEFSPVVQNDTDANKSLNRRVDIVVLPQLKE